MKPFLRVILVGMMLLFPQTKSQALFGHVAVERNRREQAEQQLIHELQHDAELFQHLYTVISALSAGVVVSLVIGAAIGSKTRREHEP